MTAPIGSVHWQLEAARDRIRQLEIEVRNLEDALEWSRREIKLLRGSETNEPSSKP